MKRHRFFTLQLCVTEIEVARRNNVPDIDVTDDYRRKYTFLRVNASSRRR